MKYTFGLFKNNLTPATGLPVAVTDTPLWGRAICFFSSSGFGGGAVYNLQTGKHVANVSA